MSLSPFEVMLVVLASSSVAGLTKLLNSGKSLELRVVVGAVLFSSVYGVGSAALMLAYMPDDNRTMWVIIGVSCFAGLGVASAQSFVAALLNAVITEYARKHGKPGKNQD